MHKSQAALDEIARTIPYLSNRSERKFDLHPALFGITIGGYFLFLAIMAAAFMNPNLAIPFAIFFIYIAMAFGTPAIWGRMSEQRFGTVQTWAEFRKEGLEVETGHIGGTGALAQVLTLPVLIVVWAIGVALIAALV